MSSKPARAYPRYLGIFPVSDGQANSGRRHNSTLLRPRYSRTPIPLLSTPRGSKMHAGGTVLTRYSPQPYALLMEHGPSPATCARRSRNRPFAAHSKQHGHVAGWALSFTAPDGMKNVRQQLATFCDFCFSSRCLGGSLLSRSPTRIRARTCTAGEAIGAGNIDQ